MVMNPDAATATESRLARRLRMQTDGERMTLHVPRFGLSMLLGVLASAALAGYFLIVPEVTAEKPQKTRYENLPGGGRLVVDAPAEFESSQATREKQILLHLGEWKAVLLMPVGFLVFLVSNRLLRRRIAFDRGNNILRRGNRPVCALDQVLSVDLDDAPRIYVMNTLALVLTGKRRMTLLHFDRSTDAALLRKAEEIAVFLRVPLNAKKSRRPRILDE